MSQIEKMPQAVIDTPDVYQVEMRDLGMERFPTLPVKETLDDTAAGEMPQAVQAMVKREEELLGLDSVSQQDEFIRARRELLLGVESDLNAELGPLKHELVGKVATYFGGSDIDTTSDLTNKLEQRIASIKRIDVTDSLGYGSGGSESSASFSNQNRQIYIKSAAITKSLASDPESAKAEVRDVVIAHEVLHGLFAAGDQGNKPAMNGLDTSHYETFDVFESPTAHGEWLNEAVLEDFRQELMGTDRMSYEVSVGVLRLLEHIKPGIKHELRVGAFDGHNKGELIGMVEDILGPLGVENVEVLGESVTGVTDIAAFVEGVSNMLPEDARAEGAKFLHSEIEQIIASNGLDKYIPKNTQEAHLFKEVAKLGWGSSADERFEKIATMSPEDLVLQMTAIHELVAPDKSHTPVDHPMKSELPNGEVTRLFTNPEDRFKIMNDSMNVVHELTAADDGTQQTREAILQRVSNVLALTLAEVHAFEDGNGRTLRTMAQLVRFGYGTKDTGGDLALVATNRPLEGFKINSFHPRNDASFEDVIKAAASLDIPLDDSDQYKKAAETAFHAPYRQ